MRIVIFGLVDFGEDAILVMMSPVIFTKCYSSWRQRYLSIVLVRGTGLLCSFMLNLRCNAPFEVICLSSDEIHSLARTNLDVLPCLSLGRKLLAQSLEHELVLSHRQIDLTSAAQLFYSFQCKRSKFSKQLPFNGRKPQ